MTTIEEKRARWFQIVEARRMAHRALGIEKGLVFVDKKANQFVFKVAIDANKLEIKKAVEKLFNVKVANVQTVLNKGKVKDLLHE